MERDGAVNLWRMDHCTLPGVATLASFGLGTRYTLALNRSASVHNNPLKSTDPTGHWIERAVARACIADDIWDIHQNGLTWDNGLALAADVGGLLLPGLTGVGMAVRGGRAAKAAAEAASLGDEAARLLGRVTTRAVGEGAQRFAWKPPRELKNVSFGKG